MEIPIDRNMKIRLLNALKNGFINTYDFPKMEETRDEFDLSILTDEEREQLLRIGEKVLEYEFK